VVDAEGAAFREGFGDRVIDVAAGGEVAAQRLFQRQPCILAARPDAASPAMVARNRDGAVERKIATGCRAGSTAAARALNCAGSLASRVT
jgi:hypothetical protein